MSFSWQPLPIGAGGNLIGLSIANDNTMVVSTDTYGAYLWSSTATSVASSSGAWVQIVNPTSMSSFVSGASSYQFYHDGVWDIQIAPKNSQIMYMIYDVAAGTYPAVHAVYKSVNQGSSWTALPYLSGTSYFSFEPDYTGDAAGTNNAIKAWGPRISIDPNDSNANTVYVGSGANGLFQTSNGGASWTSISGVPTASGYAGGTSYYPGYVVNISGFSSQQVFAYSYGNGVYLTQNGGSSWSHINSGTGPTVVTNAQVDPNTGYYFCTDTTNAWRYIVGTGWTQIYSSSGGHRAQDIAVDPAIASGGTSNHIIIGDGNGNVNESLNSGSTFGGWATANNPASTTGDISWLNLFAANDNMIFFDRAVAKKLNLISNRAFFTATYTGSLTTASPLTWNSQARGIEQLVGNVVVLPTSANPIVGIWDSGVADLSNITSYATKTEFYPGTTTVIAGWNIDYASTNTSYLCAIVNGAAGFDSNPTDSSGFSINGGTTWSSFSSIPAGASGLYASIAAQSSSNLVWYPDGLPPFYTNNGGSTWTAASVSGISNSSFAAMNIRGGLIAADRVSASTFYLYAQNIGFYKSSDGGSSFTSIASYTTGLSNGARIKTTPGVAGDFWVGGGGDQLLYYFGGTLHQIQSYPGNSYAFGFGKNASGTYPTVYYAGYGTGGSFSIWQSNNAATTTTPTWTVVSTWPNNSFDLVNDLSGDPGISGQIYVAFAGSGFAYYGAAVNPPVTYGLLQLK